MDTIYGLIQRLEEFDVPQYRTADDAKVRRRVGQCLSRIILPKNFRKAMDDDFNTPKVLAAFHEFRGEINKLLVKGLSDRTKGKARESLRNLENLLDFSKFLQKIGFGIFKKIEAFEKIPVGFFESCEY